MPQDQQREREQAKVVLALVQASRKGWKNGCESIHLSTETGRHKLADAAEKWAHSILSPRGNRRAIATGTLSLLTAGLSCATAYLGWELVRRSTPRVVTTGLGFTPHARAPALEQFDFTAETRTNDLLRELGFPIELEQWTLSGEAKDRFAALRGQAGGRSGYQQYDALLLALNSQTDQLRLAGEAGGGNPIAGFMSTLNTLRLRLGKGPLDPHSYRAIGLKTDTFHHYSSLQNHTTYFAVYVMHRAAAAQLNVQSFDDIRGLVESKKIVAVVSRNDFSSSSFAIPTQDLMRLGLTASELEAGGMIRRISKHEYPGELKAVREADLSDPATRATALVMSDEDLLRLTGELDPATFSVFPIPIPIPYDPIIVHVRSWQAFTEKNALTAALDVSGYTMFEEPTLLSSLPVEYDRYERLIRSAVVFNDSSSGELRTKGSVAFGVANGSEHQAMLLSPGEVLAASVPVDAPRVMLRPREGDGFSVELLNEHGSKVDLAVRWLAVPVPED